MVLAGAWGKGTSLWETGSLSQIQGILWWRGWKVGRRQKSREEIWSEGVSWWRNCQRRAANLGGPHREGSLSHPKNHNGQKKGYGTCSKRSMGLVNKAGEGGEGGHWPERRRL